MITQLNKIECFLIGTKNIAFYIRRCRKKSRSSIRKGSSVVHVNTRSLGKKLDLLEVEREHFDITLSETWLSKKEDNNDLRLTNFHPPVRQDRADDPHGGVAIYVRNNLYCKPRPDLHVNNLEAVWVETKLNLENLLVGSFQRPPNAKTEYWDLISESIQKVNNTMTKVCSNNRPGIATLFDWA